MAQPTVHRGGELLDLVLRLLLNQRMQQGVKPVFLFRVGEDPLAQGPALQCSISSNHVSAKVISNGM